MATGTQKSTELGPAARMAWTLAFRLSAAVLVCCLVAIVGFTFTIGYSWVYWVAVGSGVVCAGAAAVLRKFRSEVAASDAGWLLSYREGGSGEPLELDLDD